MQCTSGYEYRKHYTDFSDVLMDGSIRGNKLQCALQDHRNYDLDKCNCIHNQLFSHGINSRDKL